MTLLNASTRILSERPAFTVFLASYQQIMRIGINEWLVLSALHSRRNLCASEICSELDAAGKCLEASTVYIALQRMAKRKLVVMSTRSSRGRDDRVRDMVFYKITSLGERAIAQVDADVAVGQYIRVARNSVAR